MLPYFHPPLIQRRSLLIEPQIARQPDPAQLVLVLGGRMDHVRLVENHIAGRIIAHQPPQSSARSHPPKFLGVMRQESVFQHVLVERVDAFLGAQRLRMTHEFGFQPLAERIAILKVHETAASSSAVANRDPRGEKFRFTTAEKKFVVVDAGAQASRAVVPQHGAVY